MQQTSTSLPTDPFLRIDRSLIEDANLTSAHDLLIVSDVVSYQRQGLDYFKSRESIAKMLRASKRMVTYRMTRLSEIGYLTITTRQAQGLPNLIQVGPKLVHLLDKASQVNSEPSKPSLAIIHPPIPSEAPQKAAAIPAAPPSTVKPVQVLFGAGDMIPPDVFKTLDFNPGKGRDLTERDAVKVMALYGVAADQAIAEFKVLTYNGWPTNENQLDQIKRQAYKLTKPKEKMHVYKNFGY